MFSVSWRYSLVPRKVTSRLAATSVGVGDSTRSAEACQQGVRQPQEEPGWGLTAALSDKQL